MPRLGSQLKDISTVIEAMPEDQYEAVLSVEDTKSKKGSPMIVFTFRIDGGDYNGREITEFCTLVKKDGTVNTAGLRQIKRYAEPIVGTRVDEDEFDTAELEGSRVAIYVKQEPYESDGQTRMGNKVARVIGLA